MRFYQRGRNKRNVVSLKMMGGGLERQKAAFATS